MEGPLVVKIGGILLHSNNAIKRLFKEMYSFYKLKKQEIILVNGGNFFNRTLLQKFNFFSPKNNFCSIKKLNTMNILNSTVPNFVNIYLLAWSKRYKIKGQSILLPDFFNELMMKSISLTKVNIFLKKNKKKILEYKKIIQIFLNKNIIPFICSIGLDLEGNIFNINSDIVAMILTIILNGNLIILTDVNAVLDSKGQRIKEISHHEVNHLFDSGSINNGMVVKIKSALIASKILKKSVEITSWHNLNDLVDIFTGKSIGTKIIE
ncbi:Acetylglutamate kinase [Buchnera aphidicola (Cinara piceae)]|uniref:Acetylglutamate kinase n=1 Tax=Buchnera aphidicola (Cinara piceae) TaxID=1660043 RepID=A0A803FTB5_9GAMM|nr:hypothetical protein [Buchnera aphidicola]VFP87827.1 Acetylglutamate kinase [Buchnera aphidicola (Cinara piceae)]